MPILFTQINLSGIGKPRQCSILCGNTDLYNKFFCKGESGYRTITDRK